MDDIFKRQHVAEYDRRTGKSQADRSALFCLVKNPDFWISIQIAASLAWRTGRDVLVLPRLTFSGVLYVPALPEQTVFDNPACPKHLLVTPNGHIFKTLL